MRRGLVLMMVLSGCWDFDSLTQGYVGPDGALRDLAEADLLCQASSQREMCGDGVDNDGDCATDCADTECAADPLCAPLAMPAYGVLQTGDGAVTCGAETNPVGPALMDQISAKNTCSGCKCRGDCASQIKVYANAADCTGDKNAVETADLSTYLLNKCKALATMPAGGNNYLVPAPAPACAVDPTGNPRPDVTIGGHGRLCLPAAAAADCTTLACVLQQGGGGKICVLFDGDAMCPAPLTDKRTWFTGYTDARMCRCCNAPPMGGMCTGAVSLSDKTDCAAPIEAIMPMCKQRANTLAVKYDITPAGVMCQQTGTAPMTPAPTGTGQMTTCCVP